MEEKYESISTIGKGSYGKVLKKLDRSSGHIVAFKEFEDNTLTEGIHPCVIAEIFVLKKCNHPNIVKVLDWDKNLNWVSMVYYKTDLTNWINASKPDSQTYFNITFQILQGVNYLHNNGIIHRDIKPENVLIEFRGDGIPDVALCDFSFASILYSREEKIRLQTRTGSFYYRSPELYANNIGLMTYSFEVDMWAVGCTIGAMFLRRNLFKNTNPKDQLALIFKNLEMPSFECYMVHYCNSDSPLGPRIWTKDEYYKIIEERYKPTLVNEFKPWGRGMVSMMRGLLCIDPSLRWSAQKCLDLPLFNKISPVLREKYENIQIYNIEKNLHDICPKNIDPYKANPDILKRHINLLTNWLIEVANHYYVPLRSYLRGIYILMKVLSLKTVNIKEELQLVGAASLLLASKIESDSLPVNHEEMSYISDDKYTPSAVISMEIEILNLLGEEVLSPISLDFLYNTELNEREKIKVKFILTYLCLFPEFYIYRADELCRNAVDIVLNERNEKNEINNEISQKIALALKEDIKKEYVDKIYKCRTFRGFNFL